MQTLRIFISSPGDVREERQIAGRVIERLQGKYWSFVRLDDVFWETSAVRATAHYQDELINPGLCDIVTGILWARLGSPLPPKFRKESGETWESGTEWELEQAFAAYERSLAQSGDPLKAKPDILIYRRTAPRVRESDEARETAALDQQEKLDRYLRENYFHPDEHRTIKRPITAYQSIDEFESLLTTHLEELVLRALPGLKPGFEPPPISGCPFKGLSAFDFADSDRYFGRNRDILNLQERLRRRATSRMPFVLIYGGSGYGKSSLMRAGLAPALTRPGGALPGISQWRRVLLQPAKGEGGLCERLARVLLAPPTPADIDQAKIHPHWSLTGLTELATAPRTDGEETGASWDIASLARHLAGDAEQADAAVEAIQRALQRIDHHLLLQLDQLEEVFTVESFPEADRAGFFRAVRLMCKTRRVWAVATMRSEFFASIAAESELRELVGADGGYILSPPDAQSLREMIRYPVLAARLEYQRLPSPPRIGGDDPGSEFLDEQILADAAASADCLPLLSFTLDRLFEKRRDGLLVWDAYAALHGLKGAIAQRADEAFNSLSEPARQSSHALFAALAQVDAAHGTVIRKRAEIARLRSLPCAGELLEKFQHARLLVGDDDGGHPVVMLAHEALLTHWPVLATWISEHRADLLARQRLTDQTSLWISNRRSNRYLLSEGRLAEAQRIAANPLFAIAITDEERECLRLSEQSARRRLRFFQATAVLFAALAVAASVAGWLAVKAKEEAVTQRDNARDTLALSYHDRAVALAESDWQLAMAHAAGALRLRPESRLHGALAFSLLSRHLGDVPVAVPWEGQRYFQTVFDPGGEKALICLTSGPPALVDLGNGSHSTMQLPPGALGVAMTGILTADGSCLVNDGREAFCWSPGTPVGTEPWHGVLMYGKPAWDGGRYIAGIVDRRLMRSFGPGLDDQRRIVQLLDRNTGQRSEHKDHGKPIIAVLSLGDGRFISIGEDRKLVILDANTGRASIVGAGLAGNPITAAIAPSRKQVAVGCEKSIRIIELERPFAHRDLHGVREDLEVRSLAFSPDSRLVAAGFGGPGVRGQMRVWLAPTAEPLCGWGDFANRVREVRFDPAGERVAGVCDDGLLWLYDVGGRRLGSWVTGKQAGGVAFANAGARLAVASDETSVQMRDPQRPSKAIRKRRLSSSATLLSACGDSDAFVIVRDKGRRHQFWSVSELRPIGDSVHHQGRIVFAKGLGGDSPRMIAVFESGAVELWNALGQRLANHPGDPDLPTFFDSMTLEQLQDTNLKELYARPTTDAVDAKSSATHVAIARWRLDAARLHRVASETVSANGHSNEAIKQWWDTENPVAKGEILLLTVDDLQVQDRISVEFSVGNCRLSSDAHAVAVMNGADARLHTFKKQLSGIWEHNNIPAFGSAGTTLIQDYALSPDGRWLAAVGGFGASVLDLTAREREWRSLTTGRAVEVTFSPDSLRVAVDVSRNDDSGAAQIWELAALRPTSSLLSHNDTLRGMSFTADSQFLLTWSDDGALKCWDTADGRLAMQPWRTDKGIKDATILGDGSVVAFADSNRFFGVVALPPADPAPTWAVDVLESLARSRLDSSGNHRPASLTHLIQILPQITAAPTTGPWHGLALGLAGGADAPVPGFAVRESSEWLKDIELLFSDGDHTSAYMNLREVLRARPEIAVPESLQRLARFVEHRRDEMFADEKLDRREAGTVLQGPAGIRFRWCPPGSFLMGSPAGEPGRDHDETPHRVVLTRGFWMSETEITQGHWERVMGGSAYEHAKQRLSEPILFDAGKRGRVTCLQWHNFEKVDDLTTWTSAFGPDLPMVLVTHEDAVNFTRKMNQLMPVKAILGPWPQGGVCRLPTEAEWEFACRSATVTATYAGELDLVGQNNAPRLSRISWYKGNAAEGMSGSGWASTNWPEMEIPGNVVGIHPVGGKEPNAWGLRDMLGNVSEWCLDHYRHEATDGEVNPFATIEGANRVFRGQSAISPTASIRSAARSGDSGNWRSLFRGFRIVLLDHEATETR